jgi:hypothetical protein
MLQYVINAISDGGRDAVPARSPIVGLLPSLQWLLRGSRSLLKLSAALHSRGCSGARVHPEPSSMMSAMFIAIAPALLWSTSVRPSRTELGAAHGERRGNALTYIVGYG